MYWRNGFTLASVLILLRCHGLGGSYVAEVDNRAGFKLSFISTDYGELMYCFYEDPNAYGNKAKQFEIEYSNFPHMETVSIMHDFHFQIIEIRKSEIEKIDDDFFIDQSKLERLDLSYNKIRELNFLMKSLPSLQVLVLKHNQIVHVDGKFLPNLKQLESMDLSNNNIHNFTSGTSSSLKYLNLAHNSLSELDNSALNLENLKNLRLGYNKLKKIEAKHFGNSMHLDELDVEHNELIFIDPTIKTELMYASDNRITNFNISALKSTYLNLANNSVLIPNRIIDSVESFTLSHLDLSNNSLQSLDFLKSRKGRKIEISEVHLSSNEINHLDPEVFVDLEMNILMMKYNKIKEVDLSSLSPTLTYLELSYNPIQYIKISNPDTVLAIRLIHLSYCQLTKLDGALFQSLKNLQFLSLDHNSIDTVSTETFQNLSLHILDLSHNSIKSLPESMFAHSSIKMVDISYNSLSEFKTNPFKDSVIEKIVLNGASFFELKFNDFKGLNDISILDLSNTGIQNFKPDALSELKNLKSLCLDFNLIKIIPQDFLKNQNNLSDLSLIGNPISSIHPHAFSYKNNLTSLKLTIVGKLTGETFLKLVRLEELSIVDSDLKIVEKNSFRGLDRLKNLHFENSTILNIATGAFRSLKQLKHLNLSAMGIDTIDGHAFSDLNCLKTLNLSFNKISNLRENAYVGLKSLKILDLSHNDMSGQQFTFPIGIFRQLESLTELHLQHNNIVKLHIGEFSNLGKLEFLNLSHNQLSYIDPYVLFPLKKLKILDINSNYMTKFDHEFNMNQLTNLKTIGIGSNQWKCKNLGTMLNSFEKYKVDFLSISHLDFQRENVNGIQCID